MKDYWLKPNCNFLKKIGNHGCSASRKHRLSEFLREIINKGITFVFTGFEVVLVNLSRLAAVLNQKINLN
jgi:hypothetical protein